MGKCRGRKGKESVRQCYGSNKKCPLLVFSTWSPVGGADGEGAVTFRRQRFSVGSTSPGEDLKVYSLAPLPVQPLCFCVWIKM